MTVKEVKAISDRVKIRFMGIDFSVRVARDVKTPIEGRIFIQMYFKAPCTNTGKIIDCFSRKYYLSDHMTTDEIIKTIYSAFKTSVEHEAMESFRVDGKILFNPHINFEKLLEISHHEVGRA